MHDLTSVDFVRSEEPPSLQLALIVCDLYSHLVKLQHAISSEGLVNGRPDLDVRLDVQHLLEVGVTSPAEMEIKVRVLHVLEEVLGVQSDCYRALSRNLGSPTQACDWEAQAFESPA